MSATPTSRILNMPTSGTMGTAVEWLIATGPPEGEDGGAD